MMNKRTGSKKLAGQELVTYGMRLLAGRALSAGELRSRLLRRASSAEEIDHVMEQLKVYGFIDDARFAEHFASARRDSGSAGQQRVLRDLRSRQIPSGVAAQAAAAAFEGADEVQLVQDWLTRKFRSTDLATYLQDEKHLASAYRKLRYAGFSAPAIVRVLRSYSSRAPELEDASEDSHESASE